MNCRIVGALICQHNFAHTQTVLVSFQRKKAPYIEKSEKIVTLTNYFIHPCPCFHLTLNKISLNKTKSALDVWPRWSPPAISKAEKALGTSFVRLLLCVQWIKCSNGFNTIKHSLVLSCRPWRVIECEVTSSWLAPSLYRLSLLGKRVIEAWKRGLNVEATLNENNLFLHTLNTFQQHSTRFQPV